MRVRLQSARISANRNFCVAGTRQPQARRLRHQRNAFTLIELLIVIAIIAILTAASITTFVAPMQEQAFASIDHSRQVGESTLLARLVEDAHSADKVTTASAGEFVLQTTGTAPISIRYYVDDSKRLRRSANALDAPQPTSPGASLMDDVNTFTAEQLTTGGQYRVRLASGTSRYARKLENSHELVLNVGAAAWTGATQ